MNLKDDLFDLANLERLALTVGSIYQVYGGVILTFIFEYANFILN